jgi:hypothetical protein
MWLFLTTIIGSCLLALPAMAAPLSPQQASASVGQNVTLKAR